MGKNKVSKKDAIIAGVAVVIMGLCVGQSSNNTIVNNNIENILTNTISEERYITDNGEIITEESTASNIKIVMDAGTYTGDISNGQLKDEEGKYEFLDGTVYEGQFENGLFNGKGKLILPDVGTYEGMFVSGLRSGDGKMTFSNGDIYNGQWVNDCMSGQGTYTFKNGDTYVGSFLNNAFNGKGTYTFKSNKKKYEGTWEYNEYKE